MTPHCIYLHSLIFFHRLAVKSPSSMASLFSSSSSALNHDNRKLDVGSVRLIVDSINDYIFNFINNSEAWNYVKLRCMSEINIDKQEFFEFSERSVLSNLYWSVDSIEIATKSIMPEEKSVKLSNSERMLQAPALLDEDEETAKIPNRYLVCYSYFYLSVVKKLQGDEFQVALHFLQALSVFPLLVRTEFAPELCENLFDSFCVVDCCEEDVDKAMTWMARRYKHWLMYYQVLPYEENFQRRCRSYRETFCRHFGAHYLTSELYCSSESSKSIQLEDSLHLYCNHAKVHPLDQREDIHNGILKDEHKGRRNEVLEIQDYCDSQVPRYAELSRNSSIKCLQDMLEEPQSDNSSLVDFCCNDFEECELKEHDINKSSSRNEMMRADIRKIAIFDQELQACCSSLDREDSAFTLRQASQFPMLKESFEVKINRDSEGSYYSTSDSSYNYLLETRNKSMWENCQLTEMEHQRNVAVKNQDSQSQERFKEWKKDSKEELLEIVEEAISSLCFTEGLRKCDEDYAVEVIIVYEMLSSKTGAKYDMLKDAILEELLTSISTSKEVKIIRAAVSILVTIIAVNKSAVEDIGKKGLKLNDLATALKRNVHEAAVLIYLINPSPTDIKALELLPKLVEVVCKSNVYKGKLEPLPLTPPEASLMIIEVLVTAFDIATNNMHLAEINSPDVLCGLLDVARHQNMDILISLATILVKCMQFDGQCRKYISQLTPVGPLIGLLQSNDKHATFVALEFFHEILRMPRSSAISLLQQISKEGSPNILHTLRLLLQQLQPEYQPLAANLLLQLDILENSSTKSDIREEAIQVLLNSVASEENPSLQLLSSFILSNLGGTFSWTGEPYTVAWLVKKAGLNSLSLRNMIRNFDWLDESLQNQEIDLWCSKTAKSIIEIGRPVFRALQKGLMSKSRRVSQDSLTVVAWLGCEIAKYPPTVRFSACEILLGGIEKFLHPGLELQERFLACFCIYNYASGKGMQKVTSFSEGVRESLRRFSNVTWMAEELHKVAAYCLPNKSRISCVHTQILEVSHKHSGAVTALIYYKGLLYSGYSNGSIKVWETKGQSAILVWDIKLHKKAVTCFSLFEPGESLLSGSADKTIRVWQMVQRKLDCVEVIAIKEPIRRLDTCGQMIFVITQGHRLKVFNSKRTMKDICRKKKVKCMSLYHRKIYIGCADSSIQEITLTNNQEREFKAPAKSWRMKTKPINSILVYKDWLYSAGSIVQGSIIKDWRRHCSEPRMSIDAEKGSNIQAMGVVEDFIYLNCSHSASSLQIWLRGTQQKVGRISAGSKITSLLTANDILLCGTETGLIKGWIPL